MVTSAARNASLREDLISTISDMDYEELSSLFQYVRCTSIRTEWNGVDISATIPEDAMYSIASFLDTKSLSNWQACNRNMMSSFDNAWKVRGSDKFRNILVGEEEFSQFDSAEATWFHRFLHYSRHMRISARDRVFKASSVNHHSVETCVPLYQKVSCTVPSDFSILLTGTTYVSMTMAVRFSPEAIRSVIGLIQAPIFPLPESSLDCDRGLSRKYWGLAFGPLTGVVSSQGRYFDDFSTYRARHGLKDYLTKSLSETVEVKLGIFVHEGKIAFFRLPESDYPDWECTGFIYDCLSDGGGSSARPPSYLNFVNAPALFPAVMFSHIGHRDFISISIDNISDKPPYWPHVNESAMDFNNWNSFLPDDTTTFDTSVSQVPSPPPSSPMSLASNDYIYDQDDLVVLGRDA